MNLTKIENQGGDPQPGVLDRPLVNFPSIFTIRSLIIFIILVLAVVSRFYDIDLRVMSHDEVNHVVPSYDLFTGKGYRHDPVTHGPFQFHIVATSYFILGDSDFSSRIPAALFSIAAIAFILFYFPRYLGKNGALITAFLFLISPFMLFYGRYTRNEGFIELLGVMMLFATLAYLETGRKPYLYLLTASIVFHFCVKETAFIYTAQLLIFLALNFLRETTELKSLNADARRRFTVFVLGAVAFLVVALGAGAWLAELNKPAAEGAVEAAATPAVSGMGIYIQYALYIGLGAAFLLGVAALFNLVRSLGWEKIRHLRSFDLIVLVLTLILPQLAAFPVKLIGWDPLDYTSNGLLHTGIFILVFLAISIAVGYWWNGVTWLKNAAFFYIVYIILYTTFFTNGRGFFTGIVGSLGYWLSQQGVERGSQPWYFYGLVQMPVYEYLAVIGTLLALYFGIRHNRFVAWAAGSPTIPEAEVLPHTDDTPDWLDEAHKTQDMEMRRPVPTLALLLFWSLTSLFAYSLAGEKMPWLTVHIALPMLLTAGWGLGFLVDSTPWKLVFNRPGLLALITIPVFLMAFSAALGSLLGDKAPFMGSTLENLEATNSFILSAIVSVGSLWIILRLLRDFGFSEILRLFTAGIFIILSVLTIRTAIMANYINYDTAKEYMVYAHAARGPKDILEQVEEISRRTTGGKDLVISYDNDSLYPYWWYMRDYPNHKWYTDKPTRELKDSAVVIAGDANFSKVDTILKDGYIHYDYMRLWWPNQDYFNLTPDRVKGVLLNPEMRAAVFDIWLNRDYSKYAKLTNNSALTLETWQPSAKLRFYIRKDIAAQIWNYGAAPAAPAEAQVDPYLAKIIQLVPDTVIGAEGNGPAQFNKPRDIAVAPDGSIYVADSANQRIQHLSQDGKMLHTWGQFGDISKGTVPGGSFNEPWGIAIGLDGSVYVTDTWNHRIQKFTAAGEFVKMWGYFGQGEKPDAFWGPRGLAVDKMGNIYVTDTGNKRVVVFTPDGEFVAQFGTTGIDPGQFDEPVGVAVDQNGLVYVADTWNSRIQVFVPDTTGTNFSMLRAWEVNAWYGQSLDNKPFIDVDAAGNLFVTDPEGFRVLEFDPEGKFMMGWGDYSTGTDGFGLVSGVAVDSTGKVWISDGGNNRLLRFSLPPG